MQSGYATVAASSGANPYGIAVFSFKPDGVTTVSQAGIPASPPTTSARIFIDYRTAVNAIPARTDAGTVDIKTGMAAVNYGATTAHVTYTLRDLNSDPLTTGHGTIAAGNHFPKFIDELKGVAPDFSWPPDFPRTTQSGSLDVTSDQPISLLATTGTYNQGHECLFTTTPVADLSQSGSYDPVYFPELVDGSGYVTEFILLSDGGPSADT